MAVLQLIHNLWREGAQVVLVNIVEQFQRRGDTHVVYLWGEGGPLVDRLAQAGVPVLISTEGSRPLRHLPSILRSLARVVRERRVEVIHAHLEEGAIIAAMVSRITGVPYVVTHHSSELLMKRENPVLALVRRKAFSYAIANASFNVAVSPSVSALLRDRFGAAEDKTSLVTNGVSIPAPERLEEYRHLRQQRRASGWTDRGPVVACVGRLFPEKGQEQLLAAAPLVLRTLPRARFVFAGEGSERARLQEMARASGVAGSVEFLGSVGDVGAVLSGADLYVSTSRYEGLPMAVLEAMSWELPVIATDVAGNRDIVREGDTGRLYSLDDPEALARLIVTLADDGEEARALGAAGRHLVASRYSLDAMADTYDDLYRRARALSGGRPRCDQPSTNT